MACRRSLPSGSLWVVWLSTTIQGYQLWDKFGTVPELPGQMEVLMVLSFGYNQTRLYLEMPTISFRILSRNDLNRRPYRDNTEFYPQICCS